jgi:hypothetical protein
MFAGAEVSGVVLPALCAQHQLHKPLHNANSCAILWASMALFLIKGVVLGWHGTEPHPGCLCTRVGVRLRGCRCCMTGKAAQAIATCVLLCLT